VAGARYQDHGNKEASARRLGISKATLYRKIKTYTIRTFEFEPYPETVEEVTAQHESGRHLAT
jgi:hypothetical protein